jgi:aspartate/methionine/tyrosine aminotransferase
MGTISIVCNCSGRPLLRKLDPDNAAATAGIGRDLAEVRMQFPESEMISLVSAAPRYDLAESLGPDLRLGELLHSPAGQSGLDDLPLGYATAEGDLRLREVIARLHGVGPDDVVTTMGGMHALFLIAFILCSRDDEAIAVAPLFPPARNVLRAVGARLRALPLSFDRGYRLDIDEIRGLLTQQTRLVSLASPQNPSGVMIAPATLRALLGLMDEICPEAFLLVDETYRLAAFGDAIEAGPSALALDDKVISVASLSKCHGAPGLRLGWAITRNTELRRQLVLAKFNTVISCSPVDEALALRVFVDGDRIIGERRKLRSDGLAMTAAWVQENRRFVDWVRPDAGALCCVRLKREMFDDAAVGGFHATLSRQGVRVADGAWFGDEARVFRLGFGLLPLTELQAALRLMSDALSQTSRVAA